MPAAPSLATATRERSGSAWGAPECKRIDACRACGASALELVLSLGTMPLANAFSSASRIDEEPCYPLMLQRCSTCSLVQLGHVVSPDVLFDRYPYRSAASPPMARHLEDEAVRLASRYVREPGDLVFEIGCNDGTFLRALPDYARVGGCDPAQDHIGCPPDLHVLPERFSEALAHRVVQRRGKARLIFAANVLGHVEDLHEVFRGVRSMLTVDGAFVVEVHALADLLARRCFDQIYHEHLTYCSVAPLADVARMQGLSLTEAFVVDVQGRSLQLHFRPTEASCAVGASVGRTRRWEASVGLHDPAVFERFGTEVVARRAALRALVAELRGSGHRIAAYGASAKGNTLLNYCGLDRRAVDYVVDETPSKIGLLCPGTGIPVVGRDQLQGSPVSHLLVLAWNFLDHIRSREAPVLRAGTRLIVPFPELEVC